MKSTLLRLLIAAAIVGLVLLVAPGCVMSPKKALGVIPDGTYSTINGTITGKMSSTQLEATNATIEGGDLKAGRLHLRHSNAYVPLIELELVVTPEADAE